MIIERIAAGIYAANCYILIDEKSRETAVIDPGGDSDVLIETIQKEKGHVKYILLTHGHLDHTGAAAAIKETFQAPIFLNAEDEKLMLQNTYVFHPMLQGGQVISADHHISDGDQFILGDTIVRAIETPGHSPGGVCFYVQKEVFTGDTLFDGSIGRTDFEGGDFNTLIHSIKEKILCLDGETVVYPGHGEKTTVEKERKYNPFL